jgi:general secretion pathway protein G
MPIKPAARRAGFTLIELVIVIAIIAILAAIAIPQFGDAIRSSNDGYTKSNLGTIRKALSVYFSEIEGSYPSSLANLTTNARYLRRLPTTKLSPYHVDTANVTIGAAADDGSGWLYNNTSGSANYGSVYINCTHTDVKSSVWSAF